MEKKGKRFGVLDLKIDYEVLTETASTIEGKRPNLFWFNLFLTILLLVALVMAWLLMSVLFIVALLVNYPNFEEQQKRLSSYASNVVLVSSMIFANVSIFSTLI